MMLRGGGGGWRRGTSDTTRARDSDVQNHLPSSAYSRGRGGRSGDGRSGGGRGGGSGDAVVWTEEDDERLRKSIKDNRVDDWQTLGDWSEVAAAVGGGKTAEECFNRWQAISVGKTGYYGNSATSAHGQNFPRGVQAPPGGAHSGHRMLPSHPSGRAEEKYPAPFEDPSFHPAGRYPAHIPANGAFSGYNPQPSYPGPYDGRSVGPAIEPEVRPEPTLGLYPLSSSGGAHHHGARADEGGGSEGGGHGHYAMHGRPMWFPYQHPGPEGDGRR